MMYNFYCELFSFLEDDYVYFWEVKPYIDKYLTCEKIEINQDSYKKVLKSLCQKGFLNVVKKNTNRFIELGSIELNNSIDSEFNWNPVSSDLSNIDMLNLTRKGEEHYFKSCSDYFKSSGLKC